MYYVTFEANGNILVMCRAGVITKDIFFQKLYPSDLVIPSTIASFATREEAEREATSRAKKLRNDARNYHVLTPDEMMLRVVILAGGA